MTTGSATRVAICVATFRRPEGLDRLLAGLSKLTFSDVEPELRIVVVDNAPNDGLVSEVVEGWRPHFGEIVLEREETQGISFARNRALDAVGEADFVALIDDDESPAPEWLSELLRVQREYDADVVGGPVVPVFETDPDAWIVDGKFFQTPRHETGTELHVAYTHNVLFRWPKYRDLRFSPRYARSGGEDSHFFGRIHQAGGRIVWANDAVVREWQPPDRQTARWLIQRQYRIGLVRAIIDSELGLNKSPRRTSAWQACTRMAAGTRRFVSGLGSKAKRVKAVAQFASGAGRVAGLLGLWFEEYGD